ncbi:MAG TPA: methyltransferase domain-containing protein [Geminicoccus sp.]|uniref:methyltransferase domain-containing protein n=1 Tax=Geminicoccus sp. TaxID=2024832 RepID=UPI002CAA5C5E|nr:methyltransferase domain-containing protein [Geminicoccus sp.]HWL70299.1 methyltransferase domain-containing protein [Geminicoccus sp.]
MNGDLEQFYASRKGQLARRLIGLQLRQLWPQVAGKTIVGMGYAMPFLDVFADEAAATLALVPAGCNVQRWPETGPCRLAIFQEDEIPLADQSVDCLLLVHALETCRSLNRLMREIWRVLTDDGRVVLIVPNRHGLWSLSDTTPFGQGSPFTAGQLERLLARHLLVRGEVRRAMFVPPWNLKILQRLAIPLERTGQRLWPQFGGILLAEAEKQLYLGAPAFQTARPRRRQYVALPQAAARTAEHAAIRVLAPHDRRPPRR